jgi:hypothetical protein
VEVELIFDLRDEKKLEVYPLRYVEYFFSSRKLEEQLRILFRSSEGLCLVSLGKADCYWPAMGLDYGSI